MAKLGDRGAFFVWMGYVRWPLFALAGLVLGLLVGVVFGGLTGLVGGLVLGVLFGAMFGMVLGKDTAKFPVVVEKIVGYGGNSASFEGKYPGRVVTLSFQDEGTLVEKRVLEFLDGMKLKQLPNFSLPVWRKGEDGVRKITVLQTDSFRYYAVIWKGACLVAQNVPVYLTDDKGEVLKFRVDKAGKHLRYAFDEEKETYVVDENKNLILDVKGRLLVDAKGEPFITRYEDLTVIDTSKANINGVVGTIPVGEAAELDNDRSTYTQANRIASMMNKQGGFWNKWGGALVAVICVLVMALIFIFGVIKQGEQSTLFAEHLDNANAKAVDSFYKAELVHNDNLRIQKDLLASMERIGFRTTAVSSGATQNASATANPTVRPLQIPFVS